MQPVIPDIGDISTTTILQVAIALFGSLFLSLMVAWVYKTTHRGLSYSQSFHFSLVLLGMLGGVVMMVASGSLLQAIGILGAFSLIRFRTAIKDPKDMAFILFVLSVGLSMGAQMYLLGIFATITVCLVILFLTWLDFGMTTKHESVIRLLASGKGGLPMDAATSIEAILEKDADSFRLLSAHARGDRMEFSYGVRPKGGVKALEILTKLSKEDGIENAELFDAKHQVEF